LNVFFDLRYFDPLNELLHNVKSQTVQKVNVGKEKFVPIFVVILVKLERAHYGLFKLGAVSQVLGKLDVLAAAKRTVVFGLDCSCPVLVSQYGYLPKVHAREEGSHESVLVGEVLNVDFAVALGNYEPVTDRVVLQDQRLLRNTVDQLYTVNDLLVERWVGLEQRVDP
jgi:hypothetical protein